MKKVYKIDTNKYKEKYIRGAIREIGLALNIVNNTVTTDVIGIEPDDLHWRIDNSKEIRLLRELENLLFEDMQK